MSRLTKLISDPKQFVFDMAKKRVPALYVAVQAFQEQRQTSALSLSVPTPTVYLENPLSPAARPALYLYRFNDWKQSFLPSWFSDYDTHFLEFKVSEVGFKKRWSQQILSNPRSEILVWGMHAPDWLLQFSRKHGIKIQFAEDGFIRSVQLGASHTPPLSMAIDSRTPYFNAQEASDLEILLSQHDFHADPDLLPRARRLMAQLINTGISKYNQSNPVDIHQVYGEKHSKRILVIGQVEDDASIKYGCNRSYTNNDLVMMAYVENPAAQIIYKPHPDVLHGTRPMQSNPDDVRHICQVLDQDIPLAQSFETIDHVYTITSQAGFEALQRGIHVTTVGCPFYSGWGLTDDRQPNPRRTRKLSVEEVFAGTYILYIRYFDPIYKRQTTAEEALSRLIQMRDWESKRSAQQVVSSTTTKGQATLAPSLPQTDKQLTWMVGFSPLAEHRHLEGAFEQRNLVFLPQYVSEIAPHVLEQFVSSLAYADVMVWMPAYRDDYQYFLTKTAKQPIYLSPAPLAQWLPSDRYYALSIDYSCCYMTAAMQSDLEHLLENFDFKDHLDVIQQLYTQFLQYVWPDHVQVRQTRANALYGVKDRPRVLVLAQPITDLDVRLGGSRGHNALDIMQLARHEHPNSQIICYNVSQDPEFASALKKDVELLSTDMQYTDILYLDQKHTSLYDALVGIDQAYVLTSSAGMVALMADVRVTVLGRPFYSGWGLTDDRQSHPRRTRQLSIQQLFWVVAREYPQYIDTFYKSIVPVTSLIERR